MEEYIQEVEARGHHLRVSVAGVRVKSTLEALPRKCYQMTVPGMVYLHAARSYIQYKDPIPTSYLKLGLLPPYTNAYNVGLRVRTAPHFCNLAHNAFDTDPSGKKNQTAYKGKEEQQEALPMAICRFI